MLERLTPEQEAMMAVVRQEYIDLCDRGTHGHDKAKVQAAVEYLYDKAKKKRPNLVIHCQSPLSAILALQIIKDRCKCGDSVRASVRDSVGASVGASVRASVRASVWDSVRDSVRDSVWASVWDSVRASVGASVGDFSWSGAWDYGWCSFNNFFTRQGIVKHAKFDEYDRLVCRSGMWSALMYENVCITAMMPTSVCRDQNMRLHSTTGYAITFGDGYGQNYLWGVFFAEPLFNDLVSGKLGVPNILKLENVEQRMAALKFIGAEKLLQQCDAKLLDKSERGNKLYEIKNLEGVDVHLVRFKCPSTSREYVHFVDVKNWVGGNTRMADQAVAAMFGWDLKQYDSLVWES